MSAGSCAGRGGGEAGRFLNHPGGGGDRANSDRPRPFPVRSAAVFRADECLDLDEVIGTCAGSGGSGPGVGRPRGTRRHPRRGAWRVNCRKVPLNRPLPRPRGRRVGREQLRVQLLQLGTGIDAKLVGDHLPGLGVRIERFGMPAGLVQGPDEQQPQSLADRVLPHQPAQLGNQLSGPAARQVRLGAEFGGVKPKFVSPFGLGADERGRRDVGEQLAAPQPERLREEAGGALRLGRGERAPAFGDQLLELLQVQVAGGDAEQVPGRPVHQQPAFAVADQPPQPVHVDADQVVRLRGRAVAPQLEDQALGGDELPGPHQQASEK